MNKQNKWVFAFLILICIILVLQAASTVVAKNLTDLQALKSIFSHNQDDQQISTALQELSINDCRSNWLSIQLTRQKDHLDEYQKLMSCSDEYISLIELKPPLNITLAQQALEQRPSDPKVWFWLANAQVAAAHLPEALDSLLQVVSLDDHNSPAWCLIGKTQEQMNQIVAARDAYLKCAYTGDFNYRGYYGAGRMEEKLGNPQKAIEYYRLSPLEGSKKRADTLEKRLNP